MRFGSRQSFSLELGPYPASELVVTSIRGTEELNQPFVFEIHFQHIHGEELDLEYALAAKASLRLWRPEGSERWVDGICRWWEQLDPVAGGPRYRAVISPKLVLLDLLRGHRVFQDQTAPEIVGVLLRERAIPFESRLRSVYPKRELCIQYRESMLRFVSRLLEEEGIAYWFEHAHGKHVMVLGDSPKTFTAMEGGEMLPFRTGEMARDAEHINEIRWGRKVTSTKATVKGFDFLRPSIQVEGEASKGEGEEVYEHPSHHHQDPREAGRLAQNRLEELSVPAEYWRGTGDCLRLTPGAIFEVRDHESSVFNARLLPLRVEHSGRCQTSAGRDGAVEASYSNTFTAIQAGRPYRPEQRTRRPMIFGFQTATVVTPNGEEISTDSLARAKVRFHWDREGKNDDPSSAWVRVAQGWAGAGFGALFVPRVGQEVVLRFEGGNPDRPLMTSAVYNRQNGLPIRLPDDKSRSTMRTDSSIGGDGYNELMFEDLDGGEQIHLHAQRDEEIEVRNDKTQRVAGNERLNVSKDRERVLRANQWLFVGKDDSRSIRGNQTLLVQGDRTTSVGRNHSETVEIAKSTTVAGSRAVVVARESAARVGAAGTLTVGGTYGVNVALGMVTTVGGALRREVAGARIEVVGAARDKRVDGESRITVGRDLDTDVGGGLVSHVGKDLKLAVTGTTELSVGETAGLTAGKFTFESDRFTLVVAGRKVLTLDSSGTIELSGESITVNGQEIALRGSKLAKVAPSAPRKKSLDVTRLETTRFTPIAAEFTLVDLDGDPVVNEEFIAEFADGSFRKGVTDGKGWVRVPAPTAGRYRVTFEGRTSSAPGVPPKGSTPGAIRVTYGKAIPLVTGKSEVLELPERRNVMTIAFLFDPGPGAEYPRYVLESEDGVYRQERSPKDDMVKDDEYLQLQFGKLLEGKRYRLSKWHNGEYSELLWEGREYADVIDPRQKRSSPVAYARFVRSGRAKPGHAEEQDSEKEGIA